MRTCAVSVDLDEIPNYLAIHGLSELDGLNTNAVYEVAVPRLLSWADRVGIPLTLFAVGVDVARPKNALCLREAVRGGHEVANHTHSHRYDLTRLSRGQQLEEVQAAQYAIEEAVGTPALGFRAPGYTTTDELYSVLAESGIVYSSSVFPCPWYYAAKTLAIGLKRVLGKQSRSVIDSPRVLFAPRGPYRVGSPYWRTGEGLLELPIQLSRLGLPFIGTSLTAFSDGVARWLTHGVAGQALVNLELHGIDVLDRHDGLQALAPYQYDLRVATERKLRILTHTVEMLRSVGYRFTTLAEAARGVAVPAG